MSIKLKYKEKEYECASIIWDRDSLFLDIESYWIRIVASIAQKIAEGTTDNWTKFEQIRNESIKSFQVNPETGAIDPSSPLFIMPANNFHFLVSIKLIPIFPEKSFSELDNLLSDFIEKTILECQSYLSSSILKQKVSILEEVGSSVKQVILSNDLKENNTAFLKELKSGLNIELLSNVNKEDVQCFLTTKSLFITGSSSLEQLYKKKNMNNVLFVDDLNGISIIKEKSADSVIVNIDGASKGNPGPASIGMAFYKGKNGKKGELLKEVGESLGIQTNNFAEYTALIRALEISLENGYKNIEVLSDSELVVKQVNKLYKVKDANIKELHDKASSLISKIPSFKISHVRREENSKADELANSALK